MVMISLIILDEDLHNQHLKSALLKASGGVWIAGSDCFYFVTCYRLGHIATMRRVSLYPTRQL